MWFTNLQIYRFTKPFQLAAESLSEKLAEHAFQACSKQQTASYGWVPPLGRHASDYVHAANGYMMVCARQQERLLPASVINEQLDEKITLLQEQENRHVSRKEKQSIKEELIFDLLPRAFVRSRLQYAYIAPQQGWLVVNSASASRAEELLNALREAAGSLSVIPLSCKNIAAHSMTAWLKNSDAPSPFVLGNECELKDLQQQGSLIRCKQQDLLADEITAHIDAGMMVSKLHLIWNERIDCLVDEKLGIKRLKFSELIQEQADSQNTEDAAAQFDANFAIMTAELADFVGDLTRAFGGVDNTQAD